MIFFVEFPKSFQLSDNSSLQERLTAALANLQQNLKYTYGLHGFILINDAVRYCSDIYLILIGNECSISLGDKDRKGGHSVP